MEMEKRSRELLQKGRGIQRGENARLLIEYFQKEKKIINAKIDMEMVASFLKNAVNKVKTQENPDLLNDLKKLYKKNVPFSMRLYVAAYLVKEAQRGRKSKAGS